MQLSQVVSRLIETAREDGATVSAAEKSKRLHAHLQSCSAAQIYLLALIEYVGRGSIGIAGLHDEYDNIASMHSNIADSRALVVQRVEYLQQGREKLESHGLDIDALEDDICKVPLATLKYGEDVELTTGRWICDSCQQVIDSPSEGMVVWFRRYDGHRAFVRGMCIVHHMSRSPRGDGLKCYPDERAERACDGSGLNDDHLSNFVTHDGLCSMLELMQDEDPQAPRTVRQTLMRLVVPGYEQARPYFQKAIAGGLVTAGILDSYPTQSQLRFILANRDQLDSTQ